MSKRRTRTALVVAFVVMGVAVLGLAAAVYAKYIASINNKSASAEVAKWAFQDENMSTTLSCPLETTYNPNTLVANKIAPGTKGTCEIKLSNKLSEVGVDYTITVSNATGPANLIFKTSEGATITSGGSFKGKLTPGQDAQTVKIDWEWPYETPDGTSDGDDADTLDGRTAAGKAANGTKTMNVTFDVAGVQTKPTE